MIQVKNVLLCPHLILDNAVRYKVQKKENECCIGADKIHRSCWCKTKEWRSKRPWECQDLCTEDNGCHGYVRYGRNVQFQGCSIATTSDCPEGCSEKNPENLGQIDLDSECSTSLGRVEYKEGCVVKEKGICENAKMNVRYT